MYRSPVEVDNFIHRRIALSVHFWRPITAIRLGDQDASGGAIALLAGPLQFVPPFRERNWSRHRLLGWIYCSARIGWLCASLWIAPHSQTGWIASAGFLMLGAAWIEGPGLP